MWLSWPCEILSWVRFSFSCRCMTFQACKKSCFHWLLRTEKYCIVFTPFCGGKHNQKNILRAEDSGPYLSWTLKCIATKLVNLDVNAWSFIFVVADLIDVSTIWIIESTLTLLVFISFSFLWLSQCSHLWIKIFTVVTAM